MVFAYKSCLQNCRKKESPADAIYSLHRPFTLFFSQEHFCKKIEAEIPLELEQLNPLFHKVEKGPNIL